MVCYKSCSIALIFLIGSLYTNFNIDKSKYILPFIESLTPELKQKYIEISKERKNIYMKGLLYGLLLSIVIAGVFYKITSFNYISSICFVSAVSLLTAFFYYIITPKTSIITDLDNEKQRTAWLNIYKHMQYNYHFGLLLGIIGASIYAYSICK
jgi:uncharacterized protein YacL